MANYGMQLFKDNGTVMWDSRNVVGGFFAGTYNIPPSSPTTLTYPIFAGRSVSIISLDGLSGSTGGGVTTDTVLGYPRVSVSSQLYPQLFLVMVI